MPWWRNVLIGSLKFPTWCAINESLTFQNVTKILQQNPVTYLLVVKALNPLDVTGVILAEDVEKLKQQGGIPEEEIVVEVEGLVRKDFVMLPIENNKIGDVEKALEDGAKCVVLHRTTRELIAPEANGNEDMNLVERKHPISVITQVELKSWIADVEEHHNITSIK